MDGDFKQAGVTNNSTWYTPAGGYNTTTFYGADKIAGVDSYIGGAQDNGTHASLNDPNTSATTNYNYLLGGDGLKLLLTSPTLTRCLAVHSLIIVIIHMMVAQVGEMQDHNFLVMVHLSLETQHPTNYQTYL